MGKAEGGGDGPNAQKNVKADESKEGAIDKSKSGEAKPASEGNDATVA